MSFLLSFPHSTLSTTVCCFDFVGPNSSPQPRGGKAGVDLLTVSDNKPWYLWLSSGSFRLSLAVCSLEHCSRGPPVIERLLRAHTSHPHSQPPIMVTSSSKKHPCHFYHMTSGFLEKISPNITTYNHSMPLTSSGIVNHFLSLHGDGRNASVIYGLGVEGSVTSGIDY